MEELLKDEMNRIVEVIYLALLSRLNTNLIEKSTEAIVEKYDIDLKISDRGIQFGNIDINTLKIFVSELINRSASELGVSPAFLQNEIKAEFASYGEETLMTHFTDLLDEVEDTEVSETVEGLELGHSYLLFEDRKSKRGFQLFSKLSSKGLPGLCISRTKPEKIKKVYKLKDVKLHWLKRQLAIFFWMKSGSEYDIANPMSSKRGATVEMPLVHIIRQFINENRRCVILIEGLEYLKVINGFEKLLKGVTEITDIVMVSESILLVPIRPGSFEPREISQLEINMEIFGSPTAVYRSRSGAASSWFGSPYGRSYGRGNPSY